MDPVMQYVFAEMLGISEHFTAGSHEWLPYSVIPTFPKLICKQQFVAPNGGKMSPVPLEPGAVYIWKILPMATPVDWGLGRMAL